MSKYIKPPTFSTSFSESGKRVKRRFDNILTAKVKKKGVLTFAVIFVLVVLTGAFVACNSNLSNNDYSLDTNKLYELAKMPIGADMATLDYASDDKVIFHYSYALIVYDLKNDKIHRAIDLSKLNVPINTQGDSVIDIRSSHNGNEILIGYTGTTSSNYDKFIYNIAKNTVKKSNKAKMISHFKGLSAMDIATVKGWSSINCVKLSETKKCYLLLAGPHVSNIKIIIEDGESKSEHMVFDRNDYYNQVVNYMVNEFEETFSPYYEVVDLIVSNYNEIFEKETGMLEATFYCKMIHKNYYKDPDTVGYIKKAKEDGDPHYQTYYNEYNKEMEGNFELRIKAVIKDGKIEPSDVLLYTNASPKGTEWQKIKDLSEFIIGGSENE